MDLKTLYQRLSLSEDSLIQLSDPRWQEKASFPSRVNRLLMKNELLNTLKAFFCFDNKPLILFFDNPQNKKALHKAIWNFNETPIVIIIENNTVEIFNGFAINESTELLQSLGGEDQLNNFTYFKLVTGECWDKYTQRLKYKNRVDYRLLENIESVQKIFCNNYNLQRDIANSLIGKIIFIRYLIDRKIRLNFNNQHKIWTNSDLCTLLESKGQTWSFFEYLQDPKAGFNGDMFKLDFSDFENIPQDAFDLIVKLLNSQEITTGQQSLFDLYDFSILPIEFISNIYEKFIGKDNQANEGAYYTPTFLVDYIIKETVSKKLEGTTNEYMCKVLDPSCGSGVFLVEALRKIIEKYIKTNNIKSHDTAKFRNALRTLATENIFGIDQDYSAVQVAIFSIYLTLLDYQEPADVEKFKFPNLLGTNFICADTFDLEHFELKRLENRNLTFDFIIGNPPWMRGKIIEDGGGKRMIFPYETYITNRAAHDKECVIGNKEIAQAFILRTQDFCTANTICALVVTSKVLYNLQSAAFRKYILDKLFVNQVFEMAPVRREVFDKSNDKAIAPACVLFYKDAKGINTDDNIVKHIALKPSRFFSLFKVFTLTRNDIQQVQQIKLKEYDWLWKVMVYGSFLDFNFINRLKGFISISHYLRNNNAIVKQGLKRKDGARKIDVSELKNWDFLDLTREISQYYILNNHKKWTEPSVGYIFRNRGDNSICTDIYTPPMLLIKETVNTKLESISAISSQQLLFTDKITSIKIKGDNATKDYHSISSLINSSIFAYYVLHASSTAGIMIEQQINDEERFNFPFVTSEDLVQQSINIEQHCINTYNQIDPLNKFRELKSSINHTICNLLNLSEIEYDLLEYTNNVIIPISMKSENREYLFAPISINDNCNDLNGYARIFLDRFKNLNKNGNRIIAEVWHTQHVIGMLFKVIPASKLKAEDVSIIDKQNDNTLIPFLIKISSEKITDRLFVHKDIRGFEKDFFYIFKPNEKRLWHKAIAHIDAEEFMSAALKAGRGGE